MTGWSVFSFEVVGSTMELARSLAAEKRAPFIVLAQEQQAGRGRQGRSWASPAGGLWFTAVFPATRVAALSLFFALPILHALDRYRPGLGTKWPNDIFSPGRRKLGGILTVVSGPAFVGVGINIRNTIPPELAGQAVTLAELLPPGASVPEPEELLRAIMMELDEMLPRFEREGFASYRAEYEGRLVFLGRDITVQADRLIQGSVLGVEGDGCLRLRVEGKVLNLSEGSILSWD